MSSRSHSWAALVAAFMLAAGGVLAQGVDAQGLDAKGLDKVRVRADPNNLPFSNERGEGFENRIAELLAHDLGVPLEYRWWAQRRGFVRNTLRAGDCDIIIGVPKGYELTLNTGPTTARLTSSCRARAMSPTAAPANSAAARERLVLDRTWSRPAGLYGRLCAADHKTIAIRYLVTAFCFFLLAAAMRLQLSRPENAVLGPDAYNQVFTTHGTVMMFLFAVPIMQGLGVYFVLLMVGTREIAFPRLNAFSYWVREA